MKRIGHNVAYSTIVLILCMFAAAGNAAAQAFTTTTVQGTVYSAAGAPVSGTLQLSWPAFTAAGGQAVAAGTTSVTIGADGFVSVNLAPNLGAMPAGLYYTAIYHLADGTTSTQYWVVPAATQATLSQVQAQLMPAAQAVQAVSKAYVDQTINEAVQGQMTVFGGSLTGPLYLSGDPSQPTQAADKHYVDGAVGGALPLGGGVLTGPMTGPQIGAVWQADQFKGADFGATLQLCINNLSPTYGGTCDARNFAGAMTMPANLTVNIPNTTIYLPCSTIATAASMVIPAGVRDVTLHGCASRGTSAHSGSQGGTVILYSGTAAAIQVGDSTYAADTLGFHMDNVVVNTTAATSASAQALKIWRTQEITLSGLYLLGNSNQTGITLDGTGNYAGGTVQDVDINGFQTAVNAIGHQVANPATTDWVNASTFIRLHIDCPTTNGNPQAGTTGINLQAGDGNTFTGGDVEGCATALHLGASAQNNTLVGLRNENSTNQVVADAGSSYNDWITGGTMYTGKLTDNGTRNSFLDTFHRSFNGLNGDWYGSQQDATVTNHYRLGTGAGNERGLLDRYQTDYGNRWTTGLSDATAGEQYYQILDELNSVYRISIGQYNNGQPSSNNQTAINAAGTGAVVLNGSNNAGTGGVVIGSGGAGSTTVATISNTGNAQFNGTLLVSGTSQSAGTMTVRNNGDAEVDYYLWPGLTASQKGSFTYKDFNGNSEWYLVKDASNNWAVNSAIGGLDSFKAYQSTNSGDTYIDASNAAGHIRLNYETGAGAETDIYSGGSANLAAAFSGPASIKFPGMAATSGHDCMQIDNSGWLTNAGIACGTATNVPGAGLTFSDSSVQTTSQQGALTGSANDATARTEVTAEAARAEAAEAAAQAMATAALPADGCATTPGSNLSCPGGVSGGSTTATSLGNTGVTFPDGSIQGAASPAVNASVYKSVDTVHSGTDYGAILNAADTAQPLLQPSVLTTPAGCRPIWNPVTIDRPVTLRDVCVVPQAGGAGGVWGATPTVLTGVSLSMGATTFTLSGGCSALPTAPMGTNYAVQIGGVGLPPDVYIAGCTSGVATLSEAANYYLIGNTSGSTITNANRIAGLTTSNTLTAYGGSAIAISSIAAQAHTITLASSPGISGQGQTFAVGGSITTTLTAEVVAPAIIFRDNANALVKAAGSQNIGGGVENVWVVDPAAVNGGIGRTLTGLQGMQVFHWDQLNPTKFKCQGILGSCLIWGGAGPALVDNSGNNPARESHCRQCDMNESGDMASGQSVLVFATPASVAGEDELNILSCDECRIVYARSTAVHVTTHNTYHQATQMGPREIWFSGGGNQLEAGGYNDPTHPLPPCADMIRLSYATDFYYSGGEINGTDCGNALIANTHTVQSVSVQQADLQNYGPNVTWNVTLSNSGGRGVITYVSGGVTAGGGSTNFGTADGQWNDRFVQIIDGATCTTTAPCNYFLDSTTAEPTTATLQLPSGVTFADTATATMSTVSGGVFYSIRALLFKLWSTGNYGYGVIASTPTNLNLAWAATADNVNLAITGSGVTGNLNYYCHDFPVSGNAPWTAIPQGSITCFVGTFNGQVVGLGGVSTGLLGDYGTQTIGASTGTISTTKGGPTAGSFKSGTSGTVTVVITPGKTASNGWTCGRPLDQTTVSDTASWQQTANTTTTATLSGTTVNGDTIVWGPCTAF